MKCKNTKCELFDVEQEVSNFGKDKTRSNGFHPYCKSCRNINMKQRRNTVHGKLVLKKAMDKYRQTDYAKQKAHAYYIDNKETYRERAKEYGKREDVKKYRAEKRKKYSERNKLKELARHAVAYALKMKRLTKPNKCEHCGLDASYNELEAHHHLGYEPDNWLNVKFVHKNCHTSLHY